ncbi:MAG: WecB/TagA/CpsF family glycosyltransferase [Patescibacteria group bacterium]|jgi:N-acetylglucosaminyldiphosphoundecaprenol N-acetyl-beta-D-mannosaminyltransferase
MSLVNILGININTFTKKQALAKIQEFLIDGKQHFVVTPNPEIILEATDPDEEFFYLLNKADLSLPDGVGLKMAGWFIGVNLSRITGADFIKDILKMAEVENRRVAILNWQSGLSSVEDIKKVLANKYKNLQILVIDIERQAILPEEKLLQIKEFKPEIIFCTLGVPYQEKLIFHNLAKMPSVKIGMGIGGAFDFLTGRIKRAPKVFRIIGLEWLWRLIFHKGKNKVDRLNRWKRIYRAVIVFPYKFFLWRFILPFRYRANVACLLYKKDLETGKYKILIVERANQPNHWQLPQGGTDGEDLMKAGQRELNEELNNNKFKPIAVFEKLYQYEFGNEMSKYGVSAKTASGYWGQKQGLFIAEFLGTDNDIKINFYEYSAWRWVDAEKLVESVHPVRQVAAKIYIEKFNKFVISTPLFAKGGGEIYNSW